MLQLMLTMIERLGIIVTVALVLTRLKFFRHLINQHELNRRHQVSAMVFFGFFGIIGTYTGVTLDTSTLDLDSWVTEVSSSEAIANSRVVGITIAGLLGGYKVGIGAGLIAGLHRYTLGGFTAVACGVSSIVAGILSGFVRQRLKGRHLKLPIAFLTGAAAELVQMSIILLVSKPFDQALILVAHIGIPMIIANGIGSLLFLLIIQNVLNEEEKAGAVQAQKALRLADLTLSHLRKGLNNDSAQKVCEILFKEVEASAISITNQEKILAHVGLGDDHHKPNGTIQTDITKRVIKEGKLMIAQEEDIHCTELNCPLTMAVVAPLKRREETVGTLKFYLGSQNKISHINLELIQGLSSLLSNQLEMAEVERAYHLATELEIKALQAQINPHFLFNSLNTIISLIRTEPAKARRLLISLSRYFRQNLSGTTKTTTSLKEELNHVRAYLEIEETRFVDRLKVRYDIDPDILLVEIPPLTLQPIVENAIKHGIKEIDTQCILMIRCYREQNKIRVEIIDNGKGIDKSKLERIGKEKLPSEQGTGFGLYNVNRRLVMMFGNQAGLQFQSTVGKGTKVSFRLPVVKGEGINDKGN